MSVFVRRLTTAASAIARSGSKGNVNAITGTTVVYPTRDIPRRGFVGKKIVCARTFGMVTRASASAMKMEYEVTEDGVGEGGEVRIVQRSKMVAGKSAKNATECTHLWDDEEYSKTGQAEYIKFQEAEARKMAESATSQPAGSAEDQGGEISKKRGRGANYSVSEAASSSKKQKKANAGGPKGTAGDKTRVPKKDQEVQWHADSGCVDGTVVEVVYEEKKMDGISKPVKGSKEDPRIVVKSDSSGKMTVHEPEAVFFD